MKLWKSKKSISCVPNKSSSSTKSSSPQIDRRDLKYDFSGPAERSMSPAQSVDSGLAHDRCTIYASITLPRDNPTALGVTFADRENLSYLPIISAIDPAGYAGDFLSPGDRIVKVDGVSTIGLSNQNIIGLLSVGSITDVTSSGSLNARRPVAVVEIEYSLPVNESQNSLCVTSKLAQITVEREGGCLGLTLRGGGDYPLVVTHLRPHGPVYKTGRIKPGDRLLRVDNVSLIGRTLEEAQQIIKCDGAVLTYANLTIEYDVSVVQKADLLATPLLIEIERPMNEKLGLVLCDSKLPVLGVENRPKKNGVYIGSILPASIADRCGALSVGDQVISIDDIVIDNCACNSDDVMNLLDIGSQRGYTQMQIMPANVRCDIPVSERYGFNTMDNMSKSNRQKQGRFMRNSSLPLARSAVGVMDSNGGTYLPTRSGADVDIIGNTSNSCQSTHSPTNRVESFTLLLDCSKGSGIVLNTTPPRGGLVSIARIIADSVADCSGCIQSGDRVIAINKIYHPDLETVQSLLCDQHDHNLPNKVPSGVQPTTNWVELDLEFDVDDFVVPEKGVFTVKIMRPGKAGLGISVHDNSNSGLVILDIKPGSVAHRSGTLCVGDILLAVNNQAVRHFNVDALLKTESCKFAVLTVKRLSVPKLLSVKRNQKTATPIYSNYPVEYENDSCIGSHFDDVKHNNCEHFSVNDTSKKHYHCTCNNNDDENSFRSIPEKMTPCNNFEVPFKLQSYSPENQSTQPESTENTKIDSESRSNISGHHLTMFSVRFETDGCALGIILDGTPQTTDPIIISGLVDGGFASKQGQIQLNDQLYAINEQFVNSMSLSYATAMMTNPGNTIHLRLVRTQQAPICGTFNSRKDYGNHNCIQHSCNEEQNGNDTYNRVPLVSTIPNEENKDAIKYRIHHVTLFKDKVYDDYGFSVSDGLYERGVFINRVRSGGPAGACGVLRPFDRIMQVNDVKTQDFDCCLTVPLIAAAGDKIELIIQRPD